MQILTNEEKLVFGIDNLVSGELKHTTSLVIPQTLTLSAFASCGISYDSESENNTLLFGISAGISAAIFY